MLLLVGVAFTVWGGIRLIHLDEETLSFYCLAILGGKGQVTGQEKAFDLHRFGGLQDWLIERHSERLIRHARRAATSRWSRICRWQLEMNAFLWLMCSLLLPSVFVPLTLINLKMDLPTFQNLLCGIIFLSIMGSPEFLTQRFIGRIYRSDL